ncbi:rod shape determining protein RodA [Zhouia amylolytica]|uniref:Cell cycle protein n=2 Tax=Zhouia amylolytica TaxID=376730 RepID=W2UKM0_9FLAO|nr:rod shape-determining protein RodA [Zhouia amylolytica]ETN93862.1 cell cycle protein [Zhouia amylolytica AD3]MCQ0111693.1 rod shape-determining protein RodA [Zhouia amylolytica]SFS33789.1 rod shape determining protein RodA [Zhouia amylolytica]
MRNRVIQQIDWLSILLYFALVFIGWLNIYSTTMTDENPTIFNFDQPYGRQLIFIGLSVLLIIFVLAIETKFYARFSSVIYLISLASLLGLFVFGKNINGATSWYNFGSFGLQPSEFAKAATALALAKFLSDIQTNINDFKDQLRAFLIIILPPLFIIPQPDPGSALVYTSFFFVLYREGLPSYYLLVGLTAVILFVSTLLFGAIWVIAGLLILATIFVLYRKRKKIRIPVFKMLVMTTTAILFCLSVRYVFENVFEQRHRDRFNLWLRLEHDPSKLNEIRKTIGYNTYQSESAIGSGGLTGKGFLEGTRTKGNFVPEQHTDYIFSTVGEEWGFLGSAGVIILFSLLILRILFLAERQRSQFSRIYGYSVASILLFHFAINIGMVIGLLPTIGIPLPFFSYGGSGLWGFTILLFIFIRLDANRRDDWM